MPPICSTFGYGRPPSYMQMTIKPFIPLYTQFVDTACPTKVGNLKPTPLFGLRYLRRAYAQSLGKWCADDKRTIYLSNSNQSSQFVDTVYPTKVGKLKTKLHIWAAQIPILKIGSPHTFLHFYIFYSIFCLFLVLFEYM